MFIATVIVTVLLATGLLASTTATVTKNPKIVAQFTELDIPLRALPALATATFAGAVGIVAGLWFAPLGIAAGIGLIIYFIGAVSTHLRKNDREIAPAGLFLILAAVGLVLRIITA